jgi:hypothetical protein
MTALMLAIMMTGTGLYADTLKLFEGSILVGKIIEDEGKTILFANSYGTFRIKKTRIDNTYATGSYTEDIEIHRKMKFPVNEDEIMRNYNAGQDRKDGRRIEPVKPEPLKEESAKPEAEKETKPDTYGKISDNAEPLIAPKKKDETGDKWTSGRFSFSGSFIYNLGPGSAALPYGYGGNFALDQGLDFIPGGRHPAMFGLRFEGGYVYFKNGSVSITGFTTGAGLMWAFPSMKNSWGCIVLALMPGVSLLRAHLAGPFSMGTASSPPAYTFMGQAILGYQKSWGVFSLFVQARYMYVLYKGDDLMSVAGEVGFGLNAW